MNEIQKLMQQGQSAFEQFDYLEAVNCYRSVVTTVESSPYTPEHTRLAAAARVKMGWSFWYMGEWEMAEENFNTTVDTCQKLAFRAQLGEALMGLGWLQFYRGAFQEAGKKAAAAEQPVTAAGDLFGIAQHRLLTGAVNSRIGKQEEAEALLKANISGLEGNDSCATPYGFRLLSGSYCQLALAEFRQGNLEQAPFFTQKALDVLHGYPASIERGEAQRYLGVIRSEQGDQTAALKHHADALETFLKCGSLYHLAKIYNSLGQTYLQLEELDHSLFFFKKSLAIYEKLSITHETGALYGKIGHVYMSKEDFEQAEHYYLKDLLGSMGIEAPQNRAYLNRNVGRIFFLRKDYRQAIGYYRQAVKLFETVEDELGMASCLLELGKAYVNAGEADTARRLAEQAMQVFTAKHYEFGKAEANLLLGILARLDKDWNQALHYLRQAETIVAATKTHARRAKLLLEMGLTNKAMENHETATSLFLKALDESSRSRLLRLTSRILEHLAELDIASIVTHTAGQDRMAGQE